MSVPKSLTPFAIAVLLALILGTCFGKTFYRYKFISFGPPTIDASTAEGYAQIRASLRTQPKLEVEIRLFGVQIYEKKGYEFEEGKMTVVQSGVDLGPDAHLYVPALVLAVVFTIIALIWKPIFLTVKA